MNFITAKNKSGTDSPDAAPGRRKPEKSASRSKTTILLVIFGASLILGSIFTPMMYSQSNLVFVMRNYAILGIVSLGMSAVLLVGEADIAQGTIISFSGMLGGISIAWWGYIPAIFFTMLVGLALEAINATVITRSKVPSILVTLSASMIYQGFAEMSTVGQPVYIHSAAPYHWLAQGTILGIPVGVYFFVLLAVILAIVLKSTRLGKEAYFTGANPRAAWLSGVNTNRIKTIAMMFSGVCAGFAGILIGGQTFQLQSKMGVGYEIKAITIAVIGGTSLAGGHGSVIGTVLGTFIYTVMPGETLEELAERFHTTVYMIKYLNNLTSDTLNIGQILRIPTATTQPPQPPPAASFPHTVRPGETIFILAQRFGTTADAIRSLNNLPNNNLSVGQTLRIPGNAFQYTVRSGDSLWTLAQRFGTTPERIRAFNNLPNNNLSVGQVLLIPQ